MKICHVPRMTVADSKIDVFLEELAASGMHLDRQRAGELITGQVRAVATLMSVTRATARTYLGDEVIKDMARRMLFEVAGERPGPDLMEVPRTVPLPLALVGIAVAALAEAMQVRAANEPPAYWGTSSPPMPRRCPGRQITAGAAPEQAGQPGRDPVPAGCRRAVQPGTSQRRRRPGCERGTPGPGSQDGPASWPRPCAEDADGLIAITAAALRHQGTRTGPRGLAPLNEEWRDRLLPPAKPFRCRSSPETWAGALALAVGVAFDDELVAGGGEPVDGGLGEQLVVHEAEPFIRGPVGGGDGGVMAVPGDGQLVEVGGGGLVQRLERGNRR